MPLDEEGAKWSCEPCIRGHRSSKCEHFDRMMMKVPKAGRPLAKCPHPRGICSCQKVYAFMVRIPRDTTCLCRPVYKVPADADANPAITPAPIAPTPYSGPSRVQKPGKRQVKTAPENLARALSSVPEFGEQNAGNGAQEMPLINAQGQPRGYHHTTSNGDSHYPANPNLFGGAQGNSELQNNFSGSGSCCSSNICPDEPQQMQAQASCCGNSKPLSGNVIGRAERNAYGGSYSPLSNRPPIVLPRGSSWENYPNGNSLEEIYEQVKDDVKFDLSDLVMPGEFLYRDATNNIGFTQPPVLHATAHSPPNTLYPQQQKPSNDPEHNCSCGDNCQCLGCASHPFNNTTRQHVQEMGLLVSLDHDGQKPESMNGYQNAGLAGLPHTGQSSSPHVGYPYATFDQRVNGGYDSMASNPYAEQIPSELNNGYHSPPAEYTPEQQFMVPSEYYTLEYPVGLPNGCSDVTGSCQCGNDCNCIGCLTHNGHNGIPLQDPGSENQNLSPPGLASSQPDDRAIGTSCIPVLDNITPHFPGPVL